MHRPHFAFEASPRLTRNRPTSYDDSLVSFLVKRDHATVPTAMLTSNSTAATTGLEGGKPAAAAAAGRARDPTRLEL